MKAKSMPTRKRTTADRARHRAIREEVQSCPTQEEMQASGDYDGPVKSGAYFSVRVLIHELKKARTAAKLTLAVVAKRTGMDQATLSRLENGRQPNPTVDTLLALRPCRRSTAGVEPRRCRRTAVAKRESK